MPAVDGETLERRRDVIRDLAALPIDLDHVLERSIRFGVAFHHAGIYRLVYFLETSLTILGLSTEERNIVAGAYDRGLIKVICCTPTMAAGVNLPGISP